MDPTPPHYSVAHIFERPRQKATTDSDRTRNSKNFIGDRILAPRHRFGTGTKNRLCSFLTIKCNLQNDNDQQQETDQQSPSKTSPKSPFQTFRKAVKERTRHTHSTASPNFKVAQFRNDRSDLDEIFLRGTLLFDGQHDAVDRIFGLPTVSNRVWPPPKKNPSKIKRRFRGPITEKLKGPGQNRQRRRNGHGRNA